MGLSRTTIRINFQKAGKQAEELEQIAGNIARLASNDFAGTMQNISTNWKGENATAYVKKGSDLKRDMEDSAKELNNIASEIRRIAKNIYDAEMRALEIAQNRSY